VSWLVLWALSAARVLGSRSTTRARPPSGGPIVICSDRTPVQEESEHHHQGPGHGLQVLHRDLRVRQDVADDVPPCGPGEADEERRLGADPFMGPAWSGRVPPVGGRRSRTRRRPQRLRCQTPLARHVRFGERAADAPCRAPAVDLASGQPNRPLSRGTASVASGVRRPVPISADRKDLPGVSAPAKEVVEVPVVTGVPVGPVPRRLEARERHMGQRSPLVL
jgi:hypothetical protein